MTVSESCDESEMQVEEEEEEMLEPHVWVVVHGHYRPFGNDGSIIAFSVRAITDHNQVDSAVVYWFDSGCFRSRFISLNVSTSGSSSQRVRCHLSPLLLRLQSAPQ